MGTQQQVPKKKVKLVVDSVLLAISLISSLITIITLVIFLVPFIRKTLFSWVAQQKSYLIPTSFFILGIVLTIIGFVIYNAIYSRFYPVRWFLYGYRWVGAEYSYYILDKNLTQHSQLIKVTIRATRPGVSIFENKYKWSGHGIQESLEVLSKGHELMESMTKKLPYFRHQEWKYYYIYLGHELPLEEDVVVEIKQKLQDNDARFEPFVAKTITEPMSSLKLYVLIPVDCVFHNAYNLELNHSGPNNKVINRNQSIDQIVSKDEGFFKQLSFIVQKPHLNHRYEIRWEWPT